jgi:hypothetical protein
MLMAWDYGSPGRARRFAATSFAKHGHFEHAVEEKE